LFLKLIEFFIGNDRKTKKEEFIMARILIISTHGSEDPTRAGVAFIMAKGAVEAGHKPEILLAGDSAVLARKVVAESVLPVGLPPLKELAQFAVDHGVPVYT
jgi:predicted peroxiredoxin